jgi:hypothetical protein
LAPLHEGEPPRCWASPPHSGSMQQCPAARVAQLERALGRKTYEAGRSWGNSAGSGSERARRPIPRPVADHRLAVVARFAGVSLLGEAHGPLLNRNPCHGFTRASVQHTKRPLPPRGQPSRSGPRPVLGCRVPGRDEPAWSRDHVGFALEPARRRALDDLKAGRRSVRTRQHGPTRSGGFRYGGRQRHR